MKPLIALFLIIGSVLATQAFGEDTVPQPLTRADCEAAPNRFWSESANVCESVPRVHLHSNPSLLREETASGPACGGTTTRSLAMTHRRGKQ